MAEDRSKWTADALRREMVEREMKAAEAEAKLHEAEHARLVAFTQDFLMHHIGPDELKEVRRRVEAAAKRGAFEALIYTFPSSLCTDDGRAINSGNPEWPATLQGKAKELFDIWDRHARAMGYRLKAEIVTFPGGIPGDVGLLLNWAPLAG
ncbi:MAG: hypothetical protein QM699_11135 [Amaricoccus sp.]|uniref:hypothetical protein n=1 Tax=Amaricoccus sp. TaxID=1872485 RepID=UPI0039E4707C